MRNLNKIFKKSKTLSLDDYLYKVLYNKQYGYYSKNNPFGIKGDYITAPNISLNSLYEPKVKGTKAGPSTEVPIIPAGTPEGPEIRGCDKSISLVLTPADLNVNSAIYNLRNFSL